jgi:L-lactate dehydrogenase complex protein LldE
MSEQAKTSRRPADIYFFATCVVDQFFPGAGMDAITLLEREGIRVLFRKNRPAAVSRLIPAVFPTRRARWRHSS